MPGFDQAVVADQPAELDPDPGIAGRAPACSKNVERGAQGRRRRDGPGRALDPAGP